MTSEIEIEKLLQDIRSCKYCLTDNQEIPFVYGTSSSDILVVSEMPPKKAWEDKIGEKWKENLFADREVGAPHALCNGIGMCKEEAKKRFFWIQRANCYVSIGKEFAFQHCSFKYIPRAIDVIKPKVIITLGRIAAQYFFQFQKMEDIMKESMKYKKGDNCYSCFVLYHPSRRNKRNWDKRINRNMINKLKNAINNNHS